MAKAAGTLRIGGLTPLSTVDYPDLLSAVVFCQGCPWRCAYCHNTHLQSRSAWSVWDWEHVAAFLQRRCGLLDAVVFSGGEPTVQDGLADALSIVRQMGYRVGLHTAGVAPKRLEALLPRCDWIAMDVKAPFDDYEMTTARHRSGDRAWASLKLILDSGIDHEFRTTVHPALLTPQALLKLTAALADVGVRHYVLQEFRTQGCTNAALHDAASYLDDAFLQAMKSRLPSLSVRCASRDIL